MDERFKNVDEQKQNALNESNNLYSGLLQDNQNLYDQQKQYLDEQLKTQNENLDKQLDFQKQQIEQQKQTAKENLATESKKALNDYTSFNNPYGYNAEAMASNGLNQSGVSETAKLGSFNTYQNRLASANKTMQDAFKTYDNDLNQAILTNDVQKAENALEALKQSLSFSESYYNNKSQIQQNQFSANQNIDTNYYNRYQDVQNQINYEKEQEEARRKFEEEMAYQRERDYAADQQWQKEYELQQEQQRVAQEQWQKEYELSVKNSNKSSKSSASNISLSSPKATVSNDGANNSSVTPANTADYYFKSTTGPDYQPRYVYDTKLTKTGKKLGDIGTIKGVSSSKNVWKGVNAKGQTAYYVWDEDTYIDVTKYYK